MSAPSIPNLLSLRGDRGRGRSARGRGRAPGATRGAASASSHDATIQGTDTDAAVSRLSAVELGYLQDPFAPFFVPSTEGLAPRRLPIINRGTYTRTSALDTLVDSFLASSDGPKQIISLGAGTDTRALRLMAQEKWHSVIYHEIDYHVVCQRKLRTVKATPLLGRTLPASSSTLDERSWSSHLSGGREYHCHGVDLRQLSESPESTDPASESLPALRTDAPTLLLSECCLCYLSPSQSAGVLSYFTSRIPDIAVVIYEPIRPDDAFGKMMVSNLAARNISMPTVDVYRDGKDQEARLRQAGFEEVHHLTIEGIWDKWIAVDEKERLDVLEGLDEVEEWKLLAGHYIVVWASKGTVRFGQLAS